MYFVRREKKGTDRLRCFLVLIPPLSPEVEDFARLLIPPILVTACWINYVNGQSSIALFAVRWKSERGIGFR